jgi:hypothetical protein
MNENPVQNITGRDISGVIWREYSWVVNGIERAVRIDRPKELFCRPGGTTHRIVDEDGLVYIVPSVGVMGCFITYKPRADRDKAVRF